MRTARAGVSVETFSVAKTASFILFSGIATLETAAMLSGQTIPALRMVFLCIDQKHMSGAALPVVPSEAFMERLILSLEHYTITMNPNFVPSNGTGMPQTWNQLRILFCSRRDTVRHCRHFEKQTRPFNPTPSPSYAFFAFCGKLNETTGFGQARKLCAAPGKELVWSSPLRSA